MTREEMGNRFKIHCLSTECINCALFGVQGCGCYENVTEEEFKRNYDIVFPEAKTSPAIKDSGARTVFETGAVRDIQEDKGRCDLLPLDVIDTLLKRTGYEKDCFCVLENIANFMQTGEAVYLYIAIEEFCGVGEWSLVECILEVSMHYKQGAEKYGERNWEKGIKLHSYIDSGVRHFLKYIDGQKDERHDRAFVWNMLGAIWTMNHRPKMIDIPFELLGGQEGAGNES